MLGFKPYVTMDKRDELGRPDGTDMRLLRLLERKMRFTAEITYITSFRGVVDMVCKQGLSNNKSIVILSRRDSRNLGPTF